MTSSDAIQLHPGNSRTSCCLLDAGSSRYPLRNRGHSGRPRIGRIHPSASTIHNERSSNPIPAHLAVDVWLLVGSSFSFLPVKPSLRASYKMGNISRHKLFWLAFAGRDVNSRIVVDEDVAITTRLGVDGNLLAGASDKR